MENNKPEVDVLEEIVEAEMKEETSESELIDDESSKVSFLKKPKNKILIILIALLSVTLLVFGIYLGYNESKEQEKRDEIATLFEESIETSLLTRQDDLTTYRDQIPVNLESEDADYYEIMNAALQHYEDDLESLEEIQDDLELNGSANYLDEQVIEELGNQILELKELIESYIEDTKEEIGQTYLEEVTALIPEDIEDSVTAIEEAIETLESIIAMLDDVTLESVYLDSSACVDLLTKVETLLEEQEDALEVAIDKEEEAAQASASTNTSTNSSSSSGTVNYYGATITTEEANKANAVAKSIADSIMNNSSYTTDLQKVNAAAIVVANYCSQATYVTDSNKYYRTPYGVFIAGVYTCAGSTRALGLVLDYMGYSWTHYNENQYTHQWCVLQLDGQTGFADGMGGFAGYGTMYSGMVLSDGRTIYF